MSSLSSVLPKLRSRIDVACDQALQRTFDTLIDMPEACELLNGARQSVASGKRFRAIGAYIGAAVTSQTLLGTHDLEDLAAGLELYQASALAHDDVIDHADTRRGTPTPHRTFETMHRDRAWLGSNSDFGQAAAILLGDLLFSAAEAAVHRYCGTIPPLRGGAVQSRYATMHAEVALGQYLDVRAEQLPLDPAHDNAIDPVLVSEVVRLKSARYSVVHPVLLGANAMGANADLLAALEAIVHPWGMAFQYRDDVLGVFGDPEVTGKPAGDDLIEGKRTLLLALTWKNATAQERHLITQTFALPTQERHQNVQQLRHIIRERGLTALEDTIDSLVSTGNAALDRALEEGLINHESAQILRELGMILTKRSS